LQAKRIVTHAQKKAYFLHAGDDVIEIWNTLPATNEALEGDANKYTQCLEALSACFEPAKIFFERYKF
jgi:hypothetical protein